MGSSWGSRRIGAPVEHPHGVAHVVAMAAVSPAVRGDGHGQTPKRCWRPYSQLLSSGTTCFVNMARRMKPRRACDCRCGPGWACAHVPPAQGAADVSDGNGSKRKLPRTVGRHPCAGPSPYLPRALLSGQGIAEPAALGSGQKRRKARWKGNDDAEVWGWAGH